ncbi:FAD-binding domain-containing protein [Athelia psychrophila]|uniref:FAD-binding domain-containing protein n=1 Tax=Athelia psychrophila TaxID=1759441 RepID=A0A166FL16_9AGAM|nr:FAD-binding domain-containing protein [Fibularhizoctonia sp. CBS 109695]
MFSPRIFVRLACCLSAILPLATAVAPRTSGDQVACALLEHSLGSSKVQTAGNSSVNPLYQLSAKGAWNVFNQQDQPTCIVFPTNASDVVTAMKAIFLSNSNYAVRGGGHSAMPGWNTVENGVLIDFRQMTAYSYNPTSNTITMQPGVLWGNVYNGLSPQGVAPVGGRESDVGASGLLLGGGLSYLSPAWGYACDSYRSLQVVLTSGALVTATATNQYKDLFRALKGGGSRFGIVTSYEVQAIHVGTAADKTWYGGSILYPNTSVPALITAIDNYIFSNTDSHAVALTIVAQQNTAGVPLVLGETLVFYNGTETQFNTVFAEFLAIPTLVTSIGPLSYSDMNNILPPGNERTNANLYGASALYPHKGLFQQAFTHWQNFSMAFTNELAISTLAFTPVPQSQIDASNANGGTAFAPPNGAFAAVQLAQGFPAGVTTLSPSMSQGVNLLLSQVPRSAGLPLYLNESNEVQNALTTYNWLAQLKLVYAKYDPFRFSVNRLFGPNGL